MKYLKGTQEIHEKAGSRHWISTSHPGTKATSQTWEDVSLNFLPCCDYSQGLEGLGSHSPQEHNPEGSGLLPTTVPGWAFKRYWNTANQRSHTALCSHPRFFPFLAAWSSARSLPLSELQHPHLSPRNINSHFARLPQGLWGNSVRAVPGTWQALRKSIHWVNIAWTELVKCLSLNWSWINS